MNAEDEARVNKILEQPLPKRHALDYYAVLGAMEAAFSMLGYSREEATTHAINTLRSCKPKRYPRL